jgi:hypothetical protein
MVSRRKRDGADFHIHEPEHAYLIPAELLAMTAIDLEHPLVSHWRCEIV